MKVTGKNRNRLWQGVVLGCAVLVVPVAVPSHPEVQAQSTFNVLAADAAGETTESTDPAEVTETTDPTESTEVTESTDVTEPTETTETTESTESTESTETTVSVVPVDPATTTVTTAASLNSTSTTTTSVVSTPLAAAAITAAVAPSAPRSYRVTVVGNGRISLAWSAPASGPPSSGYLLAYAPAGGAWRSISLGGRTSWTLTGLRNGTRYYLYLYAVNGGGRSPAATATALLPSGTPRSYRVTGVGDGRISLAWSAPAAGSPSSGYVLAYAPAGGAWRSISLGGRTSWTLTGLRNGTRYYLYLYAVHNGYRSPAARAWATPSGSSAYPGNCPAARNSPGGADPWGGCWPGAHNTGVRAGTALRTYTGPCSITANNVVIDSMLVQCSLSIRGANVTIRNSRILGTVRTVDATDSFTIVDSEVILSASVGSGTLIGDSNFTAIRVETSGGNRGIYCDGPCTIRDSWVHGQNIVGDAHASGIRMSQNGTILHNSISCDGIRTPQGGGCSAGLTGYGDFEPVTNNLIQRNLFVPATSTVCAYGGASGDNGSKPYGALSGSIRFIENVFQRGTSGICGRYGAVLSFDPARPGNSWVGNRWNTGEVIPVPN